MTQDVTDKVRQYFSQYPLRKYPKGQILVFAGEAPEHVFYIVKGRVKKYDISYRGEEVVVNVFHEQAFFPMSWAINGHENHYFYSTEVATEVYITPPSDAAQFVRSNPDVMYDLLSRLYKGVEGMLGRVVQLMAGSAKSRLLYELIIEVRRGGIVSKHGNYLIPLREADLAARTGLSRETISRELGKLKAEKLLSVSTRGVTIYDIDKLQDKLATTS